MKSSPLAAPNHDDQNAAPLQQHREGHAAHMEGAIGVPEKIEEDIEPD